MEAALTLASDRDSPGGLVPVDATATKWVKFELLADLANHQQGAVVNFDDCTRLLNRH